MLSSGYGIISANHDLTAVAATAVAACDGPTHPIADAGRLAGPEAPPLLMIDGL